MIDIIETKENPGWIGVKTIEAITVIPTSVFKITIDNHIHPSRLMMAIETLLIETIAVSQVFNKVDTQLEETGETDFKTLEEIFATLTLLPCFQ